MGNPTRHFDAETYYFLTSRSIDSEFLLRPDPEVNQALGEWLVRAQEATKVEIVAYVAMSNHWHILCRAPERNIDRFVGLFKSQSSRQINLHRDGRRGPLYQRRYSIEPVFGDEALLERITYILANPAAAGLVDKAVDWPGLISTRENLHDERVTFPVFRRADWYDAGRPEDRTPFIDDREIEIHWPEFLAVMEPGERTALIQKHLEASESDHRDKRQAEGNGVLGRQNILMQSPRSRPRRTNRSNRPLCHASTIEIWRAYRDERRLFLAAYREASERYRAGEYEVEFPKGSFPPWIRMVA
jgi:REP element-mobilizing transposase RayT